MENEEYSREEHLDDIISNLQDFRDSLHRPRKEQREQERESLRKATGGALWKKQQPLGNPIKL